MRLNRTIASFASEGGITLLETVIALGILAVIGVVFLQALNTTSSNTKLYYERVTAANLAQSQVEQIKADAYRADGNYPVAVTTPPGYNVSVTTVQVQVGKQEVTVKVTIGNRPLFKLTIMKTDWA